jgi:hypothetical protein
MIIMNQLQQFNIHEFSFINIEFNLSNKAYKATRYCSKEYYKDIWNLINKYLH